MGENRGNYFRGQVDEAMAHFKEVIRYDYTAGEHLRMHLFSMLLNRIADRIPECG